MVLVASLYELSRPSSPSGLLHGNIFGTDRVIPYNFQNYI